MHRPPRRKQIRLERLENRTLLAGDFPLIATDFAAKQPSEFNNEDIPAAVGFTSKLSPGTALSTSVVEATESDLDAELIQVASHVFAPDAPVGAALTATTGTTQASVGPFEIVENPGDHPARFNVRLSSTWDSDGGLCSGTLIDSRHVITAAHCVYNENVDNDGWANEVNVTSFAPGDEGQTDIVISSGIHIAAFESYTDNGNYGYDIAIVYLERPLGVTAGGWLGYGASSCWNLTHDTHEGYSFPAEGPANGELVFWSDKFGWCPTAHLVQTSDEFYQGQSGSTVYEPGEFVVHAVASHKTAFDNTRFARLTNGKVDAIRSVIYGHRSDGPDLMPFGPHVTGILGWQTIAPKLGEKLQLDRFYVHNYSHDDFEGEVKVSLVLSENETITSSDPELWSFEGSLSIDSLGSYYFDLGEITLPESLEAGNYYAGLLVDAEGDVNSSNDAGGETDRILVTIQDVNPDLSVESVEVVSHNHYATGNVEVEIEVKNRGDLTTGNWTGDFYLSTSAFFNESAIHVASGVADPLAPDETYHTTVSLPLDAASAGGNHYVFLVVDSSDDPFEGNNRHRSDAFHVTPVHTDDFLFAPPDLRVDYVGIQSGEYEASASLPVAFSVTNTGGAAGTWHAEIWAVQSLDLNGENVKLAEGSAPELLSGHSFATLDQISLSGLSAGDYFVVLLVWSEAEEGSLFNNIGVAVDTFSIKLGLNTGPQVGQPVAPTEPDELPLGTSLPGAEAAAFFVHDEPLDWTRFAYDRHARPHRANDVEEHRLVDFFAHRFVARADQETVERQQKADANRPLQLHPPAASQRLLVIGVSDREKTAAGGSLGRMGDDDAITAPRPTDGEANEGGRTEAKLDGPDRFAGKVDATPVARLTPPAKIILPPIDLQDGVVTVLGTNANDTVTVHYVQEPGGSVTASPSEWIRVRRITGTHVVTQHFLASEIVAFDIRLLNGDDTFLNETGIRSTADGGEGNDFLVGGLATDDFRGGNGLDHLQGRGGNDVLDGEAGDDWLWGGSGFDFLVGGEGDDRLDGGDQDDGLFGGPGNDLLLGQFGNDILDGGEDSDTLMGADGRDVLVGGLGRDDLNGGAGQDLMIGGGLAFALPHAALHNLWAEWTSDHQLAHRRRNVLGHDHADFDERLNGDDFLTSATVIDDGALDEFIVQVADGEDLLIVGDFDDFVPVGPGDAVVHL